MRAHSIRMNGKSDVLQHLIKSWHIIKRLKYIKHEKHLIFSLSKSPTNFKPTTCSTPLAAEFHWRPPPNLCWNVERQKKARSGIVAQHVDPNPDPDPWPLAKTHAPRPTKPNMAKPEVKFNGRERDSTRERETRQMKERSGKAQARDLVSLKLAHIWQFLAKPASAKSGQI